MAPKVGFFLVAFGVKLVGFGKEFPIDMLRTLACIVDLMFSKFSRKPVKRTLMQSRDKALHHLFGKEFQVLKPGNLVYLLFNVQCSY